MKLQDKVYDVLKWIALVALPALTVLWEAVGNIWGFPYVHEIAVTLTAIDAFIGALIGVSTIVYNQEKEEK